MTPVLPVGGFAPAASGCQRAVVPSPWPPRSVAVYLLDAGGRWLVDSGAGTAESIASLRRALDTELGPGGRPEGVVLSHAHLDHAGGLEALEAGAVIAHRAAAERYELDDRTPRGRPFHTVHGVSGPLPGVEGWKWVLAEGHAPGHLLPWHPATGTLLAGDQFLLGLKTPLSVSDPDEDSFGAYLTSIDRAAALEPAVMLTAHTEAIRDPAGWLARERRRLERQLDRALAAVRDGARTAEEVTGRTYRTVPSEGARQLLLREKLAALRHLAARGEIRRDLAGREEVFSSA